MRAAIKLEVRCQKVRLGVRRDWLLSELQNPLGDVCCLDMPASVGGHVFVEWGREEITCRELQLRNHVFLTLCFVFPRKEIAQTPTPSGEMQHTNTHIFCSIE